MPVTSRRSGYVAPPKCFIAFPDPARRREERQTGSGTAGKRPGRMKHFGDSGWPPITHHSSLINLQSLCPPPPHPTHPSPRIHARRTVRFSDQTRLHLHIPCASSPAPRGAVTDLLRARSVPRMTMLIARFQVFLESGRTISSIKFRRRLVYSNTALKSSSTRLVQRQQTTSQPFLKLSNRFSSASPR